MAPPLPPGFVVQEQQAGPPALPPGFVIQGQEPPQSTGDIFREQLRAPLERAHPTRFPEHVEQAVREVVTEDIPQAASNALDASGTHYRTLAHGVGLPVDPPTEPEAANYRNAVIDMLMTTGGGAAGRAIGQRAGDTARYLGRGFRSIPGADRFIKQTAPHVAADAAKHVGWRDILDPAISAVATQAIFGPWDPTPWEFADQIAGGVASTAVGAGVAKNTIDDLLLSSPKWREMVMRPSSGNTAALIGALLGHYGAQLVTPEVAQAAPAARRTSVGPDAIPPPRWGRREQ